MIDCPGAASAPTAAVSLVTRPSTVARIPCAQIGIGPILLRLGLIQLSGRPTFCALRTSICRSATSWPRSPRRGRPFAVEVGRSLLRALNGTGALLHEVLVAGVFVRREFQRGLRFGDLLGGLLDLGLLGRDLGIEIF